jgi:SAM-dependent methyltransferase
VTHHTEQRPNAHSVTTVAPLSCLLCGGLDHAAIFNEAGIDVMRCRQCRHVFSSFSADAHYDGYWEGDVAEADQFYWDHARARMHKDFIARFVAGRSGRLLDMGCGLGFFLKTLRQHEGWQGYGCEISSAAVRYAHERLNLRNVVCTRLEDADFLPGFFDIVTMWDVIDHILRPDPLLARCHTLLKDNGICFIRTPNASAQIFRAHLQRLVRGEKPDIYYLTPRDHLHLYSATGIRTLLERNGFFRVEFAHLHPILSGRSPVGNVLKRVGFECVRALAILSRGRWNFDNLFVVARKASRSFA